MMDPLCSAPILPASQYTAAYAASWKMESRWPVPEQYRHLHERRPVGHDKLECIKHDVRLAINHRAGKGVRQIRWPRCVK